MTNNLNSLLKILLEYKIDFVLIGGYAGVVHGASQVTKDIDVCALITPDEVKKLREALKDLHPRHRMNPNHKPSFMTEPQDLKGINSLYLETDLGVLDVINSVTGVGDFEEVKKDSIMIQLFGHACRVISVDALIKAKEKLGRKKDLLIVAELKAIHKK